VVETVAFIMAGGRGKRMDLLCDVRPKPALPFAGRFRVIDFTLSNCVYSGIGDLAILTDYRRSQVAEYIRQWSSAIAVRTCHVLEPKNGSYKGTADSVYQNLPYLQKVDTENVLIVAGDHIYKMDYRRMLDFHRQANADVTVGVKRVPIEEAHRFGTVGTGANGEILEFVEKTPRPRSNLASMGIYVFNPDVLIRRLAEDAARSDSLHDFGYAILPGMVGRDRMFAYEFDGYWQDIGTPGAYYAANMGLISPQPAFSLNGTGSVLTGNPELPPPDISATGKVVNSLISPGCVVKGRVENSVLSPGVWVSERAEVWNSVVMPGASVGYHSIVDTCIVDEDVNIGKLCYIGLGKCLPGDGDITVLGKGVTVPDHTAIGHNCTIMPGVDASSFRRGLITPGSIISRCGIPPGAVENKKVKEDERQSVTVA
jgi:glucose-1-phosphate adenylyltransferase